VFERAEKRKKREGLLESAARKGARGKKGKKGCLQPRSEKEKRKTPPKKNPPTPQKNRAPERNRNSPRLPSGGKVSQGMFYFSLQHKKEGRKKSICELKLFSRGLTTGGKGGKRWAWTCLEEEGRLDEDFDRQLNRTLVRRTV